MHPHRLAAEPQGPVGELQAERTKDALQILKAQTLCRQSRSSEPGQDRDDESAERQQRRATFQRGAS